MDARFQRATDSQYKRTPIVSSIYSRSRGSPLRQTSPPLAQPSNTKSLAEESAVKDEIRRGKELLIQIRNKENELAHRISQSSQHHHSRLPPFDVSQLMLESTINDVQIRHERQDTNQSFKSFSSTQNLNFLKEIPIQENQLKSISRSKLSPLRESRPAIMYPLQQENLQQQHSFSNNNENSQTQQLRFMDKLQNDNATLEKRLQLVISELDRVLMQRDRVQQKFITIVDQTKECQQEIQNIESDDPGLKQGQEELLLQRQTNKGLRQTISDQDNARVNILKQLRVAQNQRERFIGDCEDLATDLDHRTAILNEIQQNKTLLQNQIQKIQNEIKLQQSTLITNERENYEKQVIVDVLSDERDNLMKKLEELSQTYEKIVYDLTQEKLKMEGHERLQRHLLAAKTLFLSMETFVNLRKQQALNEFFLYCRFDERCHRTLKQFSVVLERIGNFKQRLAIQLWYQSAFKPLAIKTQTEKQNNQNSVQKMKSKIFAGWRSLFLKSQQKRINFKQGYQTLLAVGNKQECKDKIRMFIVWRDITKLKSQQYRILNSILLRRFSRVRRQGLYKWVIFCLNSKALVQQHVLSCQFSHQRQLQLILNAFREVVKTKKSKRLIKLSLFVKEWRSWISRQKYMKAQAQKLATLKFVAQHRLLSSCFQQLRLEKEQQKVILMEETWTQKVQPEILQLNEDIRELSTQELYVKKIRSLQILSKAGRSYISSYLEHWKKFNNTVNQKLDRNMRALILRKYRQTLQQALSKLRDGKQSHKLSGQREAVDQEQMTQIDLQNTIISLTQQVNSEEFKLSYQQRLMLQHAITIFNKRTTSFGMKRWRQKCLHLSELEKAAEKISDRMKTALRRSCWRHYKHQITLCRKQDQDEAMILKRQQLRLWRTKRKIFDAIFLFYKQFNDQKTYWKITLTTLEVCLKRKGLKRWIEQGNLKKEQQLQNSQSASTLKFDEVNTELGKTTTLLQTSSDENIKLFFQLKDQGQRILSNTFARCYYTRISHGFRKWSEVTKYNKQRDQIIKRTLQHKIKSQFYILSAMWKNWVAQTRIKETHYSIEQQQMKNDECNQLIQHQQQTHFTQACVLNEEVQDVVQITQEARRHTVIAINIVTNQAQNNVYQSQLRFVFQKWVLYYRRYRQFISTVKNVISKSLWQVGFDKIREQYQHQTRYQLRETHLTAMKRLYWQKNVGRVVQMWKNCLRNQELQTITTIVSKVEHETQSFEQNVKQIWVLSHHKLENFQRSNLKKQTLKAWKTVFSFSKAMRKASSKLQETIMASNVKKMLKLWHARNQITQINNGKMKKFGLTQRQIYVSSIFRAIKRRSQGVKNFCFKLRQLGQNFDRLGKLVTLAQIIQFSKQTKTNHRKEKSDSAANLGQALHKIYLRVISLHLNQLKLTFQRQKIKDSKLKSLLGNLQSQYYRRMFMRWRDHTHYLATVEDVNMQGPVVEEVLDAQADFANSQNFMRDQGYTSLQIQQATEHSKERSITLIGRSVARMKHFNETGYLKPKMFDRWRQYIKMRQLVRYLLKSMENKLLPVKSDLAIAFSRWKVRIGDTNRTLSGLEKPNLMNRCCDNDVRLRSLDQTGHHKEFQIIQLNFERDELIDNYVRSQRLGISVARDNMQRAMAKSVSVLSDNSQRQKQTQLQTVLQRNIELIAGLKDRIMHLEFDNGNLATDNEELRQFSLDGFEIARNAQVLSSERERLSIDLADKAKTIKRLLDEHDSLERTLRESQYKAEALIKQTLNQQQTFQSSLERQ